MGLWSNIVGKMSNLPTYLCHPPLAYAKLCTADIITDILPPPLSIDAPDICIKMVAVIIIW
jgi:hypothetical protein